MPTVYSSRVDRMFDALTIAREMTEADVERAKADMVVDGIRQLAEHVISETLQSAKLNKLDLTFKSRARNTCGSW